MDGQLYYHFLSSKHAIHDLERKMIRVSTLASLNDPFELMPYLRYGTKEKISRYMEIRKKISDFYGLLCFSRTWREPLLWSHYADKHKGIALGFEINRPDIIKVVYDPNPIRKQFDLTNDPTKNKTLFLELAKIKYINWKYEQETRILVKLSDCTKIDGHHFIGFGYGLKVKEVRLGSYYDNSEEYILKLSTNIGAETIPCRLERQGYRINRDGHKDKKFKEMLNNLSNSGFYEQSIL